MAWQSIKEITDLPRNVRLAGYLARCAAIDELGAKLRSSKEDEEWTEEEQAEWDRLVDAVDNWHYALSEEEHKLLEPVMLFMGFLCRNEDPEKSMKLTCEIFERK